MNEKVLMCRSISTPLTCDFHNLFLQINFAVISVKKASEKPELFSPQMLQSNLDDGVKSFMTFFKNIGSKGHPQQEF